MYKYLNTSLEIFNTRDSCKKKNDIRDCYIEILTFAKIFE